MSIVLCVMTDGRRDCIRRTLASFDAMVTGTITGRLIHDDSGDPDYAEWLHRSYPGYRIVPTGQRSGFGGAIRNAWRIIGQFYNETRYMFHLEDDFLFNRPVNLDELVHVLDGRPYLAQMAFRRQAWNPQEHAAGGVIEQHPAAYEDRTDGTRSWLEHRMFFTTNPSLYRRELCMRGWPAGPASEGVFSRQLFNDPAVRCGYWGVRDDLPFVEHIGRERAGVGY